MIDTEYKVNNGQIAKIHVLLAQIGMAKDKEYKRNLVQQYSLGRAESTTKLTWKEACDMIADLERSSGSQKTPDELRADRKRKLILHYAHQMGWELEGKKIDMQRVNDWCVKYGYLHKELNDYTLAELSKLVWQVETAYKYYLKGI